MPIAQPASLARQTSSSALASNGTSTTTVSAVSPSLNASAAAVPVLLPPADNQNASASSSTAPVSIDSSAPAISASNVSAPAESNNNANGPAAVVDTATRAELEAAREAATEVLQFSCVRSNYCTLQLSDENNKLKAANVRMLASFTDSEEKRCSHAQSLKQI